jgi:hypothetical protein
VVALHMNVQSLEKERDKLREKVGEIEEDLRR